MGIVELDRYIGKTSLQDGGRAEKLCIDDQVVEIQVGKSHNSSEWERECVSEMVLFTVFFFMDSRRIKESFKRRANVF
jgi:hypothetical protein